MIIAVGLFAALIVISAIWVVSLRNLFRAALSLGLTLIGVAGLFLVMDAEFLALVQVLVYVGAILILIVFAIMLTSGLPNAPASPPPQQPVKNLPAAAVSIGLFAILASATRSLTWPATPSSALAAGDMSLASLGQELVKTFVLPFEVVSLVFVAAMIGAIAIATAHRTSSATTYVKTRHGSPDSGSMSQIDVESMESTL